MALRPGEERCVGGHDAPDVATGDPDVADGDETDDDDDDDDEEEELPDVLAVPDVAVC